MIRHKQIKMGEEESKVFHEALKEIYILILEKAKKLEKYDHFNTQFFNLNIRLFAKFIANSIRLSDGQTELQVMASIFSAVEQHAMKELNHECAGECLGHD